MAEAYIIDAVRTPRGVGKPGKGALSHLHPQHLAATVLKAIRDRNNLDTSTVDDIIWSTSSQNGKQGGDLGRMAALAAGYDISASGTTLDRFCGGGITSVNLAAATVMSGMEDCVIAGGTESMSNAPHYVYGMRGGVKLGDQTMVDGMIKDGLWCPTCNVHMGVHAEYTATKAGVTRAQQDAFAAGSHAKAVAAQQAGKFTAEIVTVEIPGRKGPTIISVDESPRADTTETSLAGLRPAFPSKGDNSNLTVTAGNASSLNDGAAAVVVTSEAYAREHGLTILARITAYATGAGEPQDLFFAPITAVKNLMAKAGTTIADYDLIEANEAFASQALADGLGLSWDDARVNVNGGAIALGVQLVPEEADTFTIGLQASPAFLPGFLQTLLQALGQPLLQAAFNGVSFVTGHGQWHGFLLLQGGDVEFDPSFQFRRKFQKPIDHVE